MPLPNFAGEYVVHRCSGAKRDGTPSCDGGGLTIGKTVAGFAEVDGQFCYANGKCCSFEGKAAVAADGLTFRDDTETPDDPLTIRINVANSVAEVSRVSGPKNANCGAYVSWGSWRLETQGALISRELAERESYYTAVECFALYTFLSERAKRMRGGAERAKVLDDLATNSDMWVGLFGNSLIAAEVEDEEAATTRLASAERRGELTTAVLRRRRASCDRSIKPYFKG